MRFYIALIIVLVVMWFMYNFYRMVAMKPPMLAPRFITRPIWIVAEFVLTIIFKILVRLGAGRLLPPPWRQRLTIALAQPDPAARSRMPEDIRHLWLFLQETQGVQGLQQQKNVPAGVLWDLYAQEYLTWVTASLFTGRVPTKRRLRNVARVVARMK